MLSSLFLTAYDPSDLPRESIDPLGFTGGRVGTAAATSYARESARVVTPA